MTKKIDEKRVGKAMSGTLMAFAYAVGGGKDKDFSIGKFSSNLVRKGRGLGDLASSFYYFVSSGKDAGGGTLTPAMAADAVIYIRNGILEGGHSKRYKGPPMKELGDKYSIWKHKQSLFKSSPLMSLTGTTAWAIGAKPSAGRKMVVTLNNNLMAPPVEPGGKSVKVGDYAYVHEMGTGGFKGLVSQRPIITGTMLGWVAERSGTWKRALEKLMWELVWVNMKDTRGAAGKTDFAADIVQVKDDDQHAGDPAETIANIMQQRAGTLEVLAKSISNEARSLVVRTAKGSKGHVFSGNQKSVIRSALRAALSGSGYSATEIDTIIDIALSGRIPNEYLFD